MSSYNFLMTYSPTPPPVSETETWVIGDWKIEAVEFTGLPFSAPFGDNYNNFNPCHGIKVYQTSEPSKFEAIWGLAYQYNDENDNWVNVCYATPDANNVYDYSWFNVYRDNIKIITFDSPVTDAALLAWLQTNAVKQ